MKRLFIIFFLTSIGLYAQVHKDSVSSIDSITKLALTKKIKLLQTKLDSIIKDEKKDEGEKTWSVKGRVNFVFNQTSFSNWLAGGENNTAGNIGVNYDFNYRNKKEIYDRLEKLKKIKNVIVLKNNKEIDSFLSQMRINYIP